jgi:hypothetical protein
VCPGRPWEVVAPGDACRHGWLLLKDSKGSSSYYPSNNNLFNLRVAKPPAQWRGRDREYFERCADLHTVIGDQGGTWATERATIAYAMACSIDFYVMVVDAFVTMRNDAIMSARMSSLALVEKDKLLADNMPKATALMLKARAHGISWTDACRAARIERIQLSKRFLASQGKFRTVFDHDKGQDVLQPIALGFERDLFRRHTGLFGNVDGWKVTDRGLNWLVEKSQWINEGVRSRQSTDKKKRHGSQASHQCAIA